MLPRHDEGHASGAGGWREAPAAARLTAGVVDLWRAFLPDHMPDAGELLSTLNADECARARHFRFDRDRHRFIVCRALLRQLLGRYTGLRPEQLVFSYSRYGKPELAQSGAESVCFNLSHSGDMALFAFTPGASVGVDVECVRTAVEPLEIARRFFSAAEAQALEEIGETGRQEAFCRLWTLKEACIKAFDGGPALLLGQIAMLPDALGEMCVRAGGEALYVQGVAPADGYHAAVAVVGAAFELRLWDCLAAPMR